MTVVRVNRGGRVTCRATLPLAVSARAAWGRIRDFRRFAAQDFFHAAVRVDRGGVRPGAALEIDHRFGPFSTTRVGRILQWRENVGYSFSDLSRSDPHAAFPHVYRYHLTATGPSSCELEVLIAGRWTTAWMPRLLTHLWLRWVFSHIVCSVRNELGSAIADCQLARAC